MIGKAKRLVQISSRGLELDPKFFLEFEHLRGHQVRLEGGEASSDYYCFS
jgi:selenium-binding protein 1